MAQAAANPAKQFPFTDTEHLFSIAPHAPTALAPHRRRRIGDRPLAHDGARAALSRRRQAHPLAGRRVRPAALGAGSRSQGGPPQARHRAAVHPPAHRHLGVPRGPPRRRRDAHGERQEPLLQPAGAPGRRRRPDDERALSLPDQGAQPRSGARPARVHSGRGPGGGGDGLRRRHSGRRPASRARTVAHRAHEPRHVALRNPAQPHQVGLDASFAALRRARRAAHLPRRVRLPHGTRHRAAAPHRPLSRFGPEVHLRHRHHRQPSGARGAASRRRPRRGHRGRALGRSAGEPAVFFVQPARRQPGARHPRERAEASRQPHVGPREGAGPHDRVRPEPEQRRGDAEVPAAAVRRQRRARRDHGVSRGLPARDSEGHRARAARGRDPVRRGHECARAGHRHRRPRCGRVRGLPRLGRGHLAAVRPRRPTGGAQHRPSWSARAPLSISSWRESPTI